MAQSEQCRIISQGSPLMTRSCISTGVSCAAPWPPGTILPIFSLRSPYIADMPPLL